MAIFQKKQPKRKLKKSERRFLLLPKNLMSIQLQLHVASMLSKFSIKIGKMWLPIISAIS